MAVNTTKKSFFKQHLTLHIYNDDYKEKLVVHTTGLGVSLVSLGVFLVIVLGVSALIMFTPIREFIPGYPTSQTRSAIINNALRADSLERVIHLWEIHLENMQRVLANQTPLTPEEILTQNAPTEVQIISSDRSQADSLLRASAEQEERQLQNQMGGQTLHIEGLHFFTPIKGILSAPFNPAEGHYAVDIAAPENTVIYAVLDGTVNFATWTDEYGYVIQIQHDNNLLSIYKHCALLYKKVGDQVTAGSAIAVVGKSGTYSTGYHLHFELWHQGVALNPSDYINF